MKQRIQGFILGCILSMMIFGTVTVVVAATRTIEVVYGVSIVIDGVQQDFPDGRLPFISDSITFAPIRDIAYALGLDIDWNSATSTVYLNTPDTPVDFGGVEIIIGNRWGFWCTDTAVPQTAEEDARLNDRRYVQQRYNFRIREIQLCYISDRHELGELILISIAAGDPIANIVQLDSTLFNELNEWGLIAPL